MSCAVLCCDVLCGAAAKHIMQLQQQQLHVLAGGMARSACKATCV